MFCYGIAPVTNKELEVRKVCPSVDAADAENKIVDLIKLIVAFFFIYIIVDAIYVRTVSLFLLVIAPTGPLGPLL